MTARDLLFALGGCVAGYVVAALLACDAMFKLRLEWEMAERLREVSREEP